MKVAIVLTTRWWRGSIDHDGYAAAIQALGHEPVLVCLGNDAGDANFEVVVASLETQARIDFWRNLRVDVAIVWNWLRGREQTLAMRQAGVDTILRGDTDGITSQLVFPLQTFSRMVGNGLTFRSKLGLTRYFLMRQLTVASREDREMIATINVANHVAVETNTAYRNILKFLAFHNRADLAHKLKVVSHSVSDLVLSQACQSVATPKSIIFCGGRWDSPQKDVNLLRKTLRCLLRIRPECKIVVSGPVSVQGQRGIEAISTRVICTGAITREEVLRYLRETRFLVSTSRWETQPIGALEALCLGATVVAPPLPGFYDMLESGEFGTLAAKRSANSLAEACLTELSLWDAGQRNPDAIGRFWRSRVSNSAVISSLLEPTLLTTLP